MKCVEKSCLNSAESNGRCLHHGGTPPTVPTGNSEPAVVTMAEVPTHARRDELAAKLVKRVRALQTGSALRVELKWWPKGSVMNAKKYGLQEGLRVGVRI